MNYQKNAYVNKTYNCNFYDENGKPNQSLIAPRNNIFVQTFSAIVSFKKPKNGINPMTKLKIQVMEIIPKNNYSRFLKFKINILLFAALFEFLA